MILHTLQAFRATQKGQVSVPANTEVVLLSDTHWYWWFVKVPSTDTEGFVPAELLELPCERQARINSRINVRMPITTNHSHPYNKVMKPKKRVHFNFELQFNPNELTSAGILDKISLLNDEVIDYNDKPSDTPMASNIEHLHLQRSADEVHGAMNVQPMVA